MHVFTMSSEQEDEKARRETQAQLAGLVKQRQFARGYVTRSGNVLMDLCVDDSTELAELLSAKSYFGTKLSKLEDIQEQIEVLLTEKDVEAELNEVAAYYKAKVDPVKNAASKATSRLHKAEQAESLSTVSEAPSTTNIEAKLPKIEIQKFSGGVKNWLEFWGLFKVTVEENKLADITKFSYLKSLLEGEAKQVIAGLAVTADNYKTACELLEKRYGGKDQLIYFHIQALLRVKASDKPSLTELWNLYDDVMAHVRTLEYMGIKGNQYWVVLTPIIAACFPDDLRYDWAKKGKGKEADLGFLLEYLEEEIHTHERSHSYSTDGQLDATPSTGTASALHTSSFPKRAHYQSQSSGAQSQSKCAVCDKGHPTYKCPELKSVPVEDRRQKLRGICWRCLEKPGVPLRQHTQCCTDKCLFVMVLTISCSALNLLLPLNPSPVEAEAEDEGEGVRKCKMILILSFTLTLLPLPLLLICMLIHQHVLTLLSRLCLCQREGRRGRLKQQFCLIRGQIKHMSQRN